MLELGALERSCQVGGGIHSEFAADQCAVCLVAAKGLTKVSFGEVRIDECPLCALPERLAADRHHRRLDCIGEATNVG